MSNAAGPRISVVIPSHNPSLLLYRAVRSAIRQSLPATEVFVVDDASTDDSADLIARHFPGVICLRNERNMGVSVARNRGAQAATGEFIAFLDADDEWMPDKLEKQVREMVAQRANLSFTGFRDLRSSSRLWGKHLLSGAYSDVLRAGIAFNASTFVVERDLFLKAGGFRPELRRGEDIDLFYRLALFDVRCCYLPAPLANYHHDNESSLTGAPGEGLSFARLASELRSFHPQPPSKRMRSTLLAATRHFVTRYAAGLAAGSADATLLQDIRAHGLGPQSRLAGVIGMVPHKVDRIAASALLQFNRWKQQRHVMPEKRQ